jgi:fibronectin type 3 domain-containing protein
VILACIATAVLPSAAYAADPVLFAAGDIACDPADPSFNGGLGTADACRQQATADLMVADTFDAVLALGDLQYDSATVSNFQRSYDLSWGRVKPQTYPVIGNHEGITATSGSGYCTYFGAAAHCNASGRQGGAGFYSFDLGTWHVVVLNSNCVAAGGCGVGSPQYQWLTDDLREHPATCTLAAWHHPRWSSGHDGSNAFMQPIWEQLQRSGAELVLSGHSHDYERFAPLDASGSVNAGDGMQSFVVGTGGAHFTGIGGTPEPGSEVRQNTTFGVLRLVLQATGYSWRFVPVAGRTFTDAGTRSCRGSADPGDVDPPTPATDLAASSPQSTRIDLTWSASSDNVGVTGYEVWRGANGAPPARVATIGTATSYADSGLQHGVQYRYDIRARDGSGNTSAPGAAVSAVTRDTDAPSAPPTPSAIAVDSTRVDLTWAPASDDVAVTGYELWRATAGGAPSLIAVTSATTYSDRTVAAGVSYRYTVRGTDAAGNVSAGSMGVTVATPAAAAEPPPPSGNLRAGALLASWRLRPAAARRSLARGWVSIRARTRANCVIRVRVGGRLAIKRRVGTARPLRLRLPRWAQKPRVRRQPVTVTVRIAADQPKS